MQPMPSQANRRGQNWNPNAREWSGAAQTHSHQGGGKGAQQIAGLNVGAADYVPPGKLLAPSNLAALE